MPSSPIKVLKKQKAGSTQPCETCESSQLIRKACCEPSNGKSPTKSPSPKSPGGTKKIKKIKNKKNNAKNKGKGTSNKDEDDFEPECGDVVSSDHHQGCSEAELHHEWREYVDRNKHFGLAAQSFMEFLCEEISYLRGLIPICSDSGK